MHPIIEEAFEVSEYDPDAALEIGAISFSLYLWQQPFYELHERGQGLWTLGAAILLGVASFHVVEQPARPPFAVSRSRPLCRWPSWPRYQGGDPNEAASFECTP